MTDRDARATDLRLRREIENLERRLARAHPEDDLDAMEEALERLREEQEEAPW